MPTLSPAGWRNLLLTALPIGMGIGVVGLHSVWWGVAIGWGLLIAFLVVLAVVQVVGRRNDA